MMLVAEVRPLGIYGAIPALSSGESYGLTAVLFEPRQNQ